MPPESTEPLTAVCQCRHLAELHDPGDHPLDHHGGPCSTCPCPKYRWAYSLEHQPQRRRRTPDLPGQLQLFDETH